MFLEFLGTYTYGEGVVDKWLAVVYSGIYLHVVGESGKGGHARPALLPLPIKSKKTRVCLSGNTNTRWTKKSE
jgi:hypothetical protein